MFHIFRQTNTAKSHRWLCLHSELPYVSPSSSPHILHTFNVLMTLKGDFFFDPLPSEIIRSICLQGWICFFTAWPNCKHPWRNYIKKHPVLNKRRKLGAGKQRRAPQHRLAFSYYKSLCGVQNLFLWDQWERHSALDGEISAVNGGCSQRLYISKVPGPH